MTCRSSFTSAIRLSIALVAFLTGAPMLVPAGPAVAAGLTLQIGARRGEVGQPVDIGGSPCSDGSAPFVSWSGPSTANPPPPPTSVPVSLSGASWSAALEYQPGPILVTASCAAEGSFLSEVIASSSHVPHGATVIPLAPYTAEMLVDNIISGDRYVAVAGTPERIVAQAVATGPSGSTLRMRVPTGAGEVFVLGREFLLKEFPAPAEWSAVVPPAPPGSGQRFPIYEAVTGTSLESVASVSPDGRFAMITSFGAERAISVPRVDIYGTLPGVGHSAHDGGTFAFRVGGLRSVVRSRIATREVDEFTVPLDPGLVIERFIDADGSGTVLLLLVRSLDHRGNPFTTYLYDSRSGALSTPFGVWFGSIDPAPTGLSVSADGRFVTAKATVSGGANYFRRYLRLDLLTGALTIRDEPIESRWLQGGFDFQMSEDLEWGVFVSDRPDVVPGLPAGRRLYRRNFATGSTAVVDVAVDDVERYGVFEGGRVIVSHRVETPADPSSIQLSVWDEVDGLQLLTRGVDDNPADLGVDQSDLEFAANADASRVTFTSAATNLRPGSNPPVKRLYQVVLPSSKRADAPRKVSPDESVCARVDGAAPGEFVGVNVTPVRAETGGHGVVHSSDERAGATSNVNFGRGTIDPNVAFVKVGVDGEVCFTNSRHGPVDVVVDVMVVADAGVFYSSDLFFSGLPQRALDTRLEGTPVPPGGQDCRASLLTPGTETEFVVGVNTTPVSAVAPGHGTIHPFLMSPGASSTVNFGPGTVDPNFSFVQSFDSKICFTNSVHGPVHVVIDQLVAADTGALRVPAASSDLGRPVDTRIGVGGTRLAPSSSLCFQVPGAQPGEFVGVNLTPVGAVTAGFATLHSSDGGPGAASSVNFGPGTVDPNFAMTRVGSNGRVCFTNSAHGAVDVVVDAQVVGDAALFRLPSTDGSIRILDTRDALP